MFLIEMYMLAKGIDEIKFENRHHLLMVLREARAMFR